VDQIMRIIYMEEKLNRIEAAIKGLEEALENYEDIQKDLEELVTYYDGRLWRKDFEDDEAGKIPENVNRGVLSEDGIYNILMQHKELLDKMHTFAEKCL